jgi:hypothetical protein
MAGESIGRMLVISRRVSSTAIGGTIFAGPLPATAEMAATEVAAKCIHPAWPSNAVASGEPVMRKIKTNKNNHFGRYRAWRQSKEVPSTVS